MTRSGTVYPLPPLALLTDVIECGSSLMLPTPTSGDAKASGSAGYSTESGCHSGVTLTDAERGGRGDLLQVVRGNTSPSGHFGTPTARSWKVGGFNGQLSTPPGSGGLEPEFVTWMMGFPKHWTDVEE